jgi:hypothetical protein
MKNINKYGALLIIVTVILTSCKKERHENPVDYIYYLGNSSAKKLGDAKKAASTFFRDSSLNGKFVVNDSDGNTYYENSDPSVHFQQDPKTGNFSFGNSMKNYIGDARPHLSSISEAPALARGYLKKYDIMPSNGNELMVMHTGGVKAAQVINGNKRGEEIDKIRTVTFGRVLDSVPVVGAGSKIIVSLGNNNELMGITYRWRELDPTHKKEYIAPEQQISADSATAEVRRRINQDFEGKANYKIRNMRKMLYDGNGNVLQPAYVFEVDITANIGGQVEGKYSNLYIIQAMKNSPEPITIGALSPEALRNIKNVPPPVNIR